jgi:hypothetical protein
MDAMTNELRRVMTNLALAASQAKANENKDMAMAYCLAVFNFAAFGGNVGLITDNEVADWKAVAMWSKDLPEVMTRWNGTTVVHESTQWPNQVCESANATG